MKHLKFFESVSHINEESKLNSMPAFLKAAGAKTDQFVPSVGAKLADEARTGKKINEPNCWTIDEIKSPFKKDGKITIFFFPDGGFNFTTGIGMGGKFVGKWQVGSASDTFTLGNSFTLKGVKMIFTVFGGVKTLD
jgi:hypothetical protein